MASAGAATLQIGTRPLGGGGSQWLLASTSHQCDKREGERERPNIAAHPGQKRDLATAVGGRREAHSGPWLWAAHRRERERATNLPPLCEECTVLLLLLHGGTHIST